MNFLTGKELRDIANMIDEVNGVWDILVNRNTSVGFDATIVIECTVSNGDKLGEINWSEDGAVFYPSIDMNKE